MEKTYEIIKAIILAQKKARKNNDFLTLMTNAEALLEYVPPLIDYMVEQESKYRVYEADLTNESIDGKLKSSAYCETQAKATEFYKEWQRTKFFLELVYEMVAMSKALAKGINKEFNSS